VLAATRTWDDALTDALVDSHGELQGEALARRYSGLFPDYYKTASPIRMARATTTITTILATRAVSSAS